MRVLRKVEQKNLAPPFLKVEKKLKKSKVCGVNVKKVKEV